MPNAPCPIPIFQLDFCINLEFFPEPVKINLYTLIYRTIYTETGAYNYEAPIYYFYLKTALKLIWAVFVYLRSSVSNSDFVNSIVSFIIALQISCYAVEKSICLCHLN
ncbi:MULTISPECIES: hypothetical protein [Calothrix]|uniref:Uncharacterized protein n=2 Tax=Calothrix TaxID=1186 RepID=A0ABR8ADF1_9CYAN|nr:MULTISPECIES: hypothetical protein [Calothrix]MBD2197378.1 hypothetical protein [Calothrix parietina FACHB-288]MBD2228164.1 hypothetical protein [Calothrix anomala FACHB-343]